MTGIICVQWSLDLKYGLFGDWLNGRVLVSGARDSGFDSRVPDQNQCLKPIKMEILLELAVSSAF